MLPVKQNLPADQKQLLKTFSSLPRERQTQLLDFAEFLLQKPPVGEAVEEGAHQSVQDIPRPAEESVVAAMRRLSATYPMLETESLLEQASLLMSAHLLQGQPANQVIDELEILFEQAYARHVMD